MQKQPMTAWWSATNKTMKRFSFIAAVLLCFVTVASSAIRPAQPGIGGGGSTVSGSITGAYSFNGPFSTVNATNVYLNAAISNLAGATAITNNQKSWYIWASPTVTNSYFAQNRGLGYYTNSVDFGGLLQSIFNRGVDGISIRVAASPYYDSHFVVSNTVVITNWFIMEGEGNPVTTIHGKSGMTTPVLQFGDAAHFISGICRLNRIRFEGEGTSSGSVGVHVVNCAEPVFEYCEWTGFLMAGLRISTLYNTAWSYADNCWFVQKGANAHGILFDAEPGASVIAQNHFSVKNCIFGNHTSGGSAITVSNRFPGLVIQNSHFRNYSGVSGNGITLYAGGDYKIDGNQFQNFSGGFSVFFADRLAATNYSSTVTANSAWTDGIESGHNELVYIGEYVQNVLMAGNTVRGAAATYAAANVGNGAINNFDQKELRVGSISRSNALVYLDSSGIAQPVTLSGLTFSAPTLTATGGSTNFVVTTHGTAIVTGEVSAATAVFSSTLNSQGDTTLSGSSGITANRAMYLDAGKKIQTSANVSSTELEYLDGVTSAIQTQINAISGASTQMVTAAIGALTVTNTITQLGSGAEAASSSYYETNGTKYSQLIAPNQIQTNNVLRLPTNDIPGVMVAHAAAAGTNQIANVQLREGQYVTHNGIGYVAANETYTGATNETWLNLDFNPANVTNTYIIATSATNFTVSATNLYLISAPRQISIVFPTNAASFALWFTNANGITHKWMTATNATKTNTYHREVIVYAARTNEASVYQADNR